MPNKKKSTSKWDLKKNSDLETIFSGGTFPRTEKSRPRNRLYKKILTLKPRKADRTYVRFNSALGPSCTHSMVPNQQVRTKAFRL